MDYGFWSLIPPIVAIGLAFLTKRVLLSLFAGILSGALIVTHGNIIDAFVKIIKLMWDNLEFSNFKSFESFNDSWNLFILLFLIILGIMVALISRAGGALAYGNWASKKINSKKGASLSTFLLGILIFLDDYFNSLTVGTVMKPVTDKHNISRAKLAYIIDSTAAPICIIAPISSWVAEVISQLTQSGVGTGELSNFNPYNVFLSSIFFNSYAILTIFMVILISVKKFDFGPMYEHEYNAEFNNDLFNGNKDASNEVEMDVIPGKNGKVIDLVLPVLVLIISIISFMLYTGDFVLFGGENNLAVAFENMNSAFALFWGGLISLIFTIIYFLIRKTINFKEFGSLSYKGFKMMLPAIKILIFAWTIGSIIRNDLQTGEYIVSLASDNFPIEIMPALFFIISGIVSFSTGTSWGTFGILIPIAIPMALHTGRLDLIIPMVSGVLSGAIYGDHASPISDTTILSSTGAGCHHIDHVQTQFPYATTVAIISFTGFLIVGFLAKFGLLIAGSISLIFGFITLYFAVKILHNKTEKKYSKNISK
ncbi:transporter (NhaC family) [Oceanotoga teriensis]|uniref:Transporter (NhaC family) n=1 Tax=Oceanotoga teriensis TaxID=515440 RepID=A0AA45C4Q9_9BACT|nr:Na+/H+ antiporter NhaC family protein [Oceanotoga teriensis]PWJ87135.1 transporter (NhaC family) [Oceanotoga teriensis]